MKVERRAEGVLQFCALVSVFAAGFAAVLVRFKEEQIDHAAEHRAAMASQSYRYERVSGERGRIFARGMETLAGNSAAVDIVMDPAFFATVPRSARSAPQYQYAGDTPEDRMLAAMQTVSAVVGRPAEIDAAKVRRHLKTETSRPMTVWRNLTAAELARFAEHGDAFPGFATASRQTRTYPQGSLAAHVVGRTGRDAPPPAPDGSGRGFAEMEICGRDGLELQYDEYLRGEPGEVRTAVDARGFATRREVVDFPRKGPDLVLELDMSLQRAAESQLKGVKGAIVVLDPRDGAVRAMVSSPSFDPNDCTPVFPKALYDKYASDPAKPLFNRAAGGTYAPGSTFKPATALAALASGFAPEYVYECTGAYGAGDMRIRCARTWGHGELDLVHAICESCNPYFCEIGVKTGARALAEEAKKFGFGEKTGIDLPADASGSVPEPADGGADPAGAVRRVGDVAQVSIGQGRLLVTPLQLARMAGAIGTGWLCTPRLNAALPAVRKALDVPKADLDAVRKGMFMVVERGSGVAAGAGVAARVAGKTGTAQVGAGTHRRKNTLFVAYATPAAGARRAEPLALAVIVEDGETGGATAAPRAGAILREFYGGEGA